MKKSMKISFIIFVITTIITFFLKINHIKILSDIIGLISIIFLFRFLYLVFKGYFLQKSN